MSSDTLEQLPAASWAEVVLRDQNKQFGDTWLRAAAIQQDGIVYEGPRHHVIIHTIFAQTGKRVTGKQGLSTNHETFVSRQEANEIARRNGQSTVKRLNANELYNKELWHHQSSH